MRRDGNRPKVPTLRGLVGGKVKRVPARTGLGWVGLGWVGKGQSVCTMVHSIKVV